MSREKDPVEHIVRTIESDLNGRSGCGFDGIDEETREGIRESWRSIVNDVLSSELREVVLLREAVQVAGVGLAETVGPLDGGPCSLHKCEGCEYEWGTAERESKKTLNWLREHNLLPTHEPGDEA